MDLLQSAIAVMIGNILTLCFIWGMVQFHRHDYKAPWLAYAAVTFPLFFALVAWITVQGPPEMLSAIALR